MIIDVSGAFGGISAASFAMSVACTASASSNLSWLIRPISAESHSDPLVILIASLNFPPIQVGFRMFAVFFWIFFHRLLSSTFVGRFMSLNSFFASSTKWMKVLTRLETFGIRVEADVIVTER